MNQAISNNILVVAAHPDDEVLGCGGTIARMAGEGQTVIVAILGEGAVSRHMDRNDNATCEITKLQEESRRAASILGAAGVHHCGFPDNAFDTLPLLRIVKTVEELIHEYKPQTIYTHHASDLNIDHSITNRAVLTATRPLPGNFVRDIYAFAILSSTEWSFGSTKPMFSPNVFVDITATLDVKLTAMQVYESEVRPSPHPRSPESLKAAATLWGSTAGFLAAEPFQLIRSLRPDTRK